MRDGGRALIEASGAIPALVRVIKRTRWPSEPEKQKSRNGRWAHDFWLSPCVHMSRVSNDLLWLSCMVSLLELVPLAVRYG
jgi:hypothetical protein